MLLSALLFSMMDAFVKILAQDFGAVEILFFRSFVMVLLIMLTKDAIKKPIKKKGGLTPLILRSVAGAIAMLALFYNIKTLPLGVAITFLKSMPIYAVFLAWLFLKERASFGVILSAIVGFLGIIVISDPFGSSISPFNIFMGVISGLGAAIAMTALRSSREYFSNNFIVLTFGLVTTILALIVFALPEFFVDNSFIFPNLPQFGFIILMGICGTIAQVFLTKSYASAPAAIVSPFTYTEILFSIILGIALGDRLLQSNEAMGIVLIIISGFLVALPIFIKDFRKKHD